MRALRFLREEFYYYSVLNALYQSLMKRIACKRCKVFAFYVNKFTFYSLLNTLYQSLIKNSRVKDAR